MDYAGQVIVFFAALIALRGETWDGGRKGLLKLTASGWAISVLACAGLLVSCVTTYRDAQSANDSSDKLGRALGNTEQLKAQLESASLRTKHLESQLSEAVKNTAEANLRAEKLGAQLAVYRGIIDEIKSQSERQIQQTMASYVRLYPSIEWRAYNYVHSGDIIRFMGFDCDIKLTYGLNELVVPERQGFSPTEVAISGPSGHREKWSLSSERECSGKVFVYSTPRSRSGDWSWVEERVRSASQREESAQH